MSKLLKSQTRVVGGHALASVLNTKVSRLSTVILTSVLLASCVSQQASLDYSQQSAGIASPNSGSLQLSSDSASSVDGADQSSVEVVAANIPVKAPRQNVAAASAQTSGQASTTSQAAAPRQDVAAAVGDAPSQTTALAIVNDQQAKKQAAVNSGIINSAVETTQTASLDPALQPNTSVQTKQVVAPSASQATAASAAAKKPVQKVVTRPAPKKPAAKNQNRSLFSLFKRKPKKPRPPNKVRNAGTRSASAGALPGVKSNAELFGIKESEEQGTSGATQVAALGSLGRVSPNGLRVQHSKVQVACLKPGVLRILKAVERRYRSKPIITSGYRSPKGNRRAGGARNSQHIFCKAVDIQVEGVTKWQLAKFLRSIPGRGGVGTYCRTKSVHFDIGSERDWHHPCRRSTVRKRKS